MNPELRRNPALSMIGIVAMFMAYVLAFTVLSDTDMASKCENGVAPPGTDVASLRVTAVASVLAAAGAWVSVIAGRAVIPIMLVLIASAPFALVSLFTLQLAF
ncbi:hypothetical protein KL864_31630 [Mycolicibacterium goodii]|uniref:hypothetical protein n=1 Tax=Mycolicibacterium goodii TaxID=134601 RepID=UPI001BDC195F|nr:hypothetical protein [Mycolicibacterium goodii]MBU8820428.1 hypothetical protein [Mycolicibacterium goodii]